jgi:uncharacterized phiE125 gp8 family phage protein
MLSLRLITAPTIEPVTVAEVKSHTHISSDASEDANIAMWITTARKLAEDYQRRAYIRQTWELAFDRFPAMPLDIPRPPLIDIVSVKYYATDNTEYTYDLSNLIIDTSTEPGRISLRYLLTWPTTTLRPIDAIKIRYDCGYSSTGDTLTTTESPDASHVPEYIKDAIHIYCAYRYENRACEAGDVPQQFYHMLGNERCWL